MSKAAELLADARAGKIAQTARLLSIVENDEPEAAEVIRATFPQTGRAIKVRTLPPTQSGGSGPAGTDSTGIKARTGGRSSSKENLP